MLRHVVERLCRHLDDLIADSKKISDASAKERRQFHVAVQPTLADLLQSSELNHPEPRGLSTRTGPMHVTNSFTLLTRNGLYGSAAVNAILTGIYVQLDEEHERVLYPKTSNKTRGRRLENRSMREYLRLLIVRTGCSRTEPCTLFQLCSRTERTQDWTFLLPDGGTPTWQLELRIIALEHVREPSRLWNADLAQWREKYTGPGFAKLVEKFYFVRADTRAYFIDYDPLRTLAGSIVQLLIQPKQSVRYGRLKWSRIYKRKDKNTLDLTLRVPLGSHVEMNISDISSFTSSNVNSWLLVLTMLTEIENNPKLDHLNEPFVIVIEGWPVEVTLKGVLRLFLYRTVACLVHDKSTGEQFSSAGGYLGMNGNMALTMAAFALEILDQGVLLRTVYNVQHSDQLGGDDFARLLAGENHNVIQASEFAKQRTQTYVGNLKELRRRELHHLSPGVHALEDVLYCKKATVVNITETEDERVYHVTSRPTPSIPRQLLEFTPDPDQPTRESKETSYELMLLAKQSEELFDCAGLDGVYIRAKELLDGPLWPLNLEKVRPALPIPDFVQEVDGFYYSPRALTTIKSVPTIVDSLETEYLVSIREKSLYLQRLDKLGSVAFHNSSPTSSQDEIIYVTTLQSEVRRLEKPFRAIVPQSMGAGDEMLARAIAMSVARFRSEVRR